MNRNEEYQTLLSQLEQETPPPLGGCVERARKKARRRRGWGTSLASLGGVAAAFVLLVNTSVPFAMACARIPGLRELTAAVAFSPSLKTAVENDYVQLIGQTQTADGITLKMEYLIFDPTQLHFFFTVDGGDYDSFHVYPSISGPDGEELEGYGITSAMSLPGELSDFGVTFNEGFRAPEALKLTCRVTGHRERTGVAPADSSAHDPETHREPEVIARFTFDLILDPRFTAPGRTLPIEQWVTVDGQRLLIRSLEINPTHARLTVVSDEANTAWCKGLDWLDKDRAWVRVDLDKGAAQGLPDGVELVSARREPNGDVALSFSSPGHGNGQLFSWDYRDPEGRDLTITSGGHSRLTDDDGQEYEEQYIILPDYSFDTVELKLSRTRTAELDPEVTLEIE